MTRFGTLGNKRQRVAPLMDDYPDADGGVPCMRSPPNFSLHVSRDHAVAARLLPVNSRVTRVRGYWLIHDDTRRGRGLRARPPLLFWNLTSEQDCDMRKLQ